ncbi:RadC family protein [Wolbachia endosymbiont of Cantharis cryptica]|uniref:JAB domain-containing protein n=1 Tax=Wolbachia endosymbiont of Cantharis cryptica TaxID=3066132 RepID=UPI00376EDE64
MNNKNKSKDRREEIEFRILESKGHALRDHELMEMFLSATHDRDEARVIAKRLMDSYKGIGRLLGQEMDDLKTTEGVTDSTVAVIQGANTLVNRVLREKIEKGPLIDNWEKLTDYLRVNIGYSERENLKVLFLNKGCYLIGEETYVGSASQIPIFIMEIIRKIALKRATSIIISHNQPGGTVKPSERDKAMTKKLASVCDNAGIELIDHVIVTGEGYYSFKRNRLL